VRLTLLSSLLHLATDTNHFWDLCFGVSSGSDPSHYFSAFFLFFFAKARRSVFFRRFARFLALSLPLLCPIRTQPWPAYRDVAMERMG